MPTSDVKPSAAFDPLSSAATMGYGTTGALSKIARLAISRVAVVLAMLASGGRRGGNSNASDAKCVVAVAVQFLQVTSFARHSFIATPMYPQTSVVMPCDCTRASALTLGGVHLLWNG